MVNAVKVLEVAGPIKLASSVSVLLQKLQKLILDRNHRFYIQHIRAHTGLPGPLATGNNTVDSWTRAEYIFLGSAIELATQFHQKFHVNAKTL